MTKGRSLAAIGVMCSGREFYQGRHFSSRAADCRVRPLLLAFRILAGELRRSPLQAFLLVLKARIASPGSLQRVADFHVQPPQAVDFELDLVAVLECREAPVVGAG